MTFEVEDARGNKVFKQKSALSRFGVASADFDLADEVNMGISPCAPCWPSGQAEKTVRVERYVLPKFKVALTTDKPYYLPGETVQGTLDAHYFFGKPVGGAAVTLAVNTVDIGVTKLGEVTGKTDASGQVHIRLHAAKFVCRPAVRAGQSVVEFAGTVKDTADHTQEAQSSLPVVKDPILLVIVPEHRGLVPGVENRVFIAAATPDGQPLKGIRLADRPVIRNAATKAVSLTTDDLGLATLTFTPTSQEPMMVCGGGDGRRRRTRPIRAASGRRAVRRSAHPALGQDAGESRRPARLWPRCRRSRAGRSTWT